MAKNVSISLECAALDTDEIKQLKKDFKTNYNVTFKHIDRPYDPCYATWIISGTYDNVKKFIIEEYLQDVDIDELDDELDADVLKFINNN